MARRRRRRKNNPPPLSEPECERRIPSEFFETSRDFHMHLLANMKPGYICRVTNAGKLYLGPSKKVRRMYGC